MAWGGRKLEEEDNNTGRENRFLKDHLTLLRCGPHHTSSLGRKKISDSQNAMVEGRKRRKEGRGKKKRNRSKVLMIDEIKKGRK